MNKSSIYNTLILLPIYWLFSGMLVISDGDKPMVAFVLVSIAATLCNYGLSSAKTNLKQDKTLWVILAMTAYAGFSYHYHGLSSREIRALLSASIFLTFFPREILTKNTLKYLLFIGSLCSLGFAFYYGPYTDLFRGFWPINAIPQATLSASIGLIALSLSVCDTKQRTLTTLAFLFCAIAVVISESRGLWLGYFTLTGFVLVLKFKHLILNKKTALLCVAIVMLSGFTLKPIIESRVNSTVSEINRIVSGDLSTSIGQRLELWKLAPKIVNGHLLLGQGSHHKDKFNELYLQGEVSENLKQLNPAHYHNQYVDKAVKGGLIGLLLFIFSMLQPLYNQLQQSPMTKYTISSLVLLYAIAGLTDVPFNHAQTLLLYLILICTLQATAQNKENYD